MDRSGAILHIDDDPPSTRIIAQRLKKLGYEVTSLNDPARAVGELRKSRQPVVLLDVDMPTADGLEPSAHDQGRLRRHAG